MSDTAHRAMTVEEACAAYGEDARWELIEGEVIEMTPASGGHGRLLIRMGAILSQWQLVLPAQRRAGIEISGGDSGWMLASNPDTVVAPDITIHAITPAEWQTWDPGFRQGAPNYAIEILSPSDRMSAVQSKVRLLLATGALEVWIVDAGNRTMTVHDAHGVRILEENDTYEGTGILEGFRLPVAELFRAP